jgi:hypothetical protein
MTRSPVCVLELVVIALEVVLVVVVLVLPTTVGALDEAFEVTLRLPFTLTFILVVSALNSDVPAAFWSWKAAVESTAFLKSCGACSCARFK